MKTKEEKNDIITMIISDAATATEEPGRKSKRKYSKAILKLMKKRRNMKTKQRMMRLKREN